MSNSKILYNIKKVVITPLDETTGLPKSAVKPININTSEEAKLNPLVSKGNEKILRVENAILATASEPDLVYGYDVELTDNKFDLAILEFIEGGTITYDEVETTKIVSYDSPMMEDGYVFKPFSTDIYVEERKGSAVTGYCKFTLNFCTGKAPEFSFKKGEFYSPTFSIDARENTLANKPVKSISFVKNLPS